MLDTKGMKVQSSIGERSVDSSGSLVAVAKMDTDQVYTGIPGLLKEHINNRDAQAWEEITTKIDGLYAVLDPVLGALDEKAGMGDQIRPHMKEGKKLLFKPNLVSPVCIDPVTHGVGGASGACTQWPFVAAVMRWFHDKLDIPYNEMTLGEAGTGFPATSVTYGRLFNGGTPVTTESIFEGKRGDFYGGWGFYFVRKYLADTHEPSHEDDPMNGHEESISGEYLPAGKAGNRLMVYDLNRVRDVRSKARDVRVPGGVNFKEITLHKAIVGGDPDDPGDMKNWPGCVLVNLPRLKAHIHEPLTNATKNLGIGLYPMEATVDDEPESTRWKYSVPDEFPPSQKAGLPHEVWRPQRDEKTGLPMRDEQGEYIVTKTGGLKGTIVDVLKATESQNVLMVHIVSAIEPIGAVPHVSGTGTEGYVYASMDTVALDNLCYRTTCKSVPVGDARKLQKEGNLPTDFMQKVPVPVVDGPNIVTAEGYDTPISRSNLLRYAEERGLGRRSYYVDGWDGVEEKPLVTVEGHLGRLDGQRFTEIITPQLLHQGRVMLWGRQATTLGYFKANDSLTGSSYLSELLEALDEDGDGVLSYEETGKKGYEQMFETWLGEGSHMRTMDRYGSLRAGFLISANSLRYSSEEWNADGHDFCKESRLASAAAMALGMSYAQTEQKDSVFPTMTWGKGKWPSVQHCLSISARNSIYGSKGPGDISMWSIYGNAFQYADKTLNGGGYTGGTEAASDRDAFAAYIEAISGGASLLDFMFYVPKGYGPPVGMELPNVEEAEDPAKILTADFGRGKEVW